jgi:hypothetical protein
MLLGKTKEERYKASQARLERLYNKRLRVYALWPKKLTDGRIAWLQWVWKKVPVMYVNGDEPYYYKFRTFEDEYYAEPK